MDKYRRLLNNTFLLLIGNFGSKVLSFFMVRYYTDVYSTSEYGIIDLITATAGFVVPLITLGINEAVFRFSIDDVKNRKKIYLTSMVIALCGNCLLALLCLFNFNTIIHEYRFLLLAFCFSDSFYMLTSNYCRGIERTALYAFAGVLQTALQIVVAILSISVFGLGIEGYFLASCASYIISGSIILVRFKKDEKGFEALDGKLLKSMLRYSIPLIANTCCWWIMASLDKYVIAYQLDSDANGLFAAASKIPSVVTMLSTILYQAWQISYVTELNSNDKEEFHTEIHDFLYVTIACASSLILALIKPIFAILVSEDFSEAWVISPYLILAMNFSCLASFFGTNYVGMKKTKGALYTSLIAAVVNCVLNIVLTKYYGMVGTAFATMISYCVLWIVRWITTAKMSRIDTCKWRLIITFGLLAAQAAVLSNGFYHLPMQLLFTAVLVVIQLPVIKSTLKKALSLIRERKNAAK